MGGTDATKATTGRIYNDTTRKIYMAYLSVMHVFDVGTWHSVLYWDYNNKASLKSFLLLDYIAKQHAN